MGNNESGGHAGNNLNIKQNNPWLKEILSGLHFEEGDMIY